MIPKQDLQGLIKSGETSKEIALKYNCHYSTIRRLAKKYKIQWVDTTKPKKTDSFVGSTYDRLTVISFSHYLPKYKGTGRKAVWNCKCECGNFTKVENSNLISGQTKSCGCLHIVRLRKLHNRTIKIEGPFYAVLRDYKRGAEDRLLTWELTEEQFRTLTSMDCQYCGEPPSKVKDRNGSAMYRGNPYTYNGIDRVDNKIGYTTENSISCCWMCNMLKGTFGKNEFINKAKQIAKHQQD